MTSIYQTLPTNTSMHTISISTSYRLSPNCFSGHPTASAQLRPRWRGLRWCSVPCPRLGPHPKGVGSRDEQQRSCKIRWKKASVANLWSNTSNTNWLRVGSRSVQVYAKFTALLEEPSRFVQETVSFSPMIRIWRPSKLKHVHKLVVISCWLQITSAFWSEPLEIANAGMCGSLEDLAVILRIKTMQKIIVTIQANTDSGSRSAPRPIVTADVRIATMSNFAPAANCPHHAWGVRWIRSTLNPQSCSLRTLRLLRKGAIPRCQKWSKIVFRRDCGTFGHRDRWIARTSFKRQKGNTNRFALLDSASKSRGSCCQLKHFSCNAAFDSANRYSFSLNTKEVRPVRTTCFFRCKQPTYDRTIFSTLGFISTSFAHKCQRPKRR